MSKSNLTSEQQKLIRTEAFKKWFGDWELAYSTAGLDFSNPVWKGVSKVVDENGEPKIMYHGSLNKFTIFKTTQKEGTWRYPYIFLAETEIIARYFAQKNITNELKRNRIFVYKLFVKTNNPFDLFSNTKDKDIVDGIMQNRLIGKNDETWYYLETKEISEMLKNRGYDGIYAQEKIPMQTTKNIGVFNANQIKLADGTNTTFDIDNPDIRYKEGGQINGFLDMKIIDFLELKIF